MRRLEFSLALLTFITFQIFCQEDQEQTFAFDSIKTIQQNLNEELKFRKFFQHDSRKRMSLNDLSNLNIYNKAINDSALFMKNNNLEFNENYKDQTEDFKESFKLLLEYAKHNQNKYDLGEFGRYLGISRNIMAIILALISSAR